MPSDSAKADTAANNAVFRGLHKMLSHNGLRRHSTEEALYDATEEPLRACGKASFMVWERLFRTTAKPVPHADTVIMAHKNGSPMCPKSRFQFFKVRKRADGSVSDASRHVSRHIAFSLSRISVVKIFYFRKRIFIHFHISLCHIRRRHAS